ncbi:MAG: type IX secretion system membrane protein PorP/SprF [Bacteroidetes bacterium]|uniref:Type IX secretion system membrane protein PorP/SprF n=1 Tax=Phaeocystidibacter marisrubri TaxID=1577780 RepID=A0A6L3ZFP1_9FLAO|nr:type IX secretion system membrane protein PorP/SprF [Phaeocystidibacter marisrubri]KAB2816856.1 type IX secretion system membrane protein PorP/SprF [Phaeocystidibacter marisrubri]TNE29891.1 MAG: type IX secretion system membrane protein PorP/SprF [Bacteroidota bacterium]GGH77857.1 membrane protein [Phaeocystidibacter marisrubri]
MKLAKRNNINILGGYKAVQSSEHAYMKKLLTLLVLGAGLPVFAQQDIQFTQYMNNRLYYNAGVAGSSGSICINGTHRTQWAGFTGAPVTQNLNAEIPIPLLHGGISLGFTNDAIGVYNNQIFSVGYAYQMPFAEGTLGIGVSFDFNTSQVANGVWITPDNNPIDPQIAARDATGFAVDGTFGLYYQGGPLWAGVSTRKLIGAQTDYSSMTGEVTQFTNARHYFVMGGYDINLQGTNIVLTPSTMIKFDEKGLNPQADINVTAMYNNQIWGGVTYRIQDAFAIMAGYRILPNLRVAYSYDLTTSDLNVSSSGSHEITASYCFKIEIPPHQQEQSGNHTFL